MRLVWGSCLGLLLCVTVVFAGISSEDLKERPASEDDILSLLRDEQLILRLDDDAVEGDDEEGKGTCDEKGYSICLNTNQKCEDLATEPKTYLCGDCADGYESNPPDSACVPCICSEGKKTECEKLNKECTKTANEETCDACGPGLEEREGGVCRGICSEGKKTECEKLNKECTKSANEETCDACGAGLEEREGGVCRGICSEGKKTECEKLNKECTKTANEETCDACGAGLEEREGGVCRGICSEGKKTECEKLNKECTKTANEETCDACGAGLEEREGGVCRGICSEGKKTECEKLNKECTKTANEETCDACGAGLEEREGGVCRGICSEGKKTECEKLNKECTKTANGETCDACGAGLEEREGGVCRGICSEGKKTECEKLNKECTKTANGETCDACGAGLEEREGGVCRGICSEGKKTECEKLNKECTKTANGETCDACGAGLEEREGGVCRGICSEGKKTECEKLNKECTKTANEETCDACGAGLEEREGGVCRGICSEGKKTECEKLNKECTKTANEETCDACGAGLEEREGGVCRGICSEGKKTECEKLNKECTKTANEETCDACGAGLEERKDGVCRGICSEGKKTECEKLNKECTKTANGETCDACGAGLEEREGGVCRGICSEGKKTECKKLNKECTKTANEETCDACGAGLEERKDGVCRGICSEGKKTECKKLNKECTKTANGETCDACGAGLEEREGGVCRDTCGDAEKKFCKAKGRVCSKRTSTGQECGTCLPNHVEIDKDTCKPECDCGEGICSTDGTGVCTCEGKKKYYNKKCIDCDCGVGDCEVDENGKKKDCKCKPHIEKLYEEKCVETCLIGKKECQKANKECSEIPSGYACNECLSGFIKLANGNCVDSCKTKGNQECNDKKRKCNDTEAGYECDECFDGYKEDSGKCKKKCAKDADCKNGKCGKSELCECDDGYGGDFCDTIPTCDTIKAKCLEAKAECKYDKNKGKGVCVCNDSNFVFKNDKCETHKWCEPNPCSGAECSVTNGVGHCKCADEKQYYDYRVKACKKINLCLSKKDSCPKNQKCNPTDGKCVCVEGFYREEESKDCKPNTCEDHNPCFNDAECKNTGVSNIVRCTCGKQKFYDGKGCIDGGCFLNDRNCSSCPDGTKYNEKNFQCEIVDQSKKCNKGCGFGWCLKEGDDESCVCYEGGFVEKRDGKCVLSTQACASKEVEDGEMKCNCTGIYTLSDDGITCRRKTCEDADVLKKCKDQNAKCVTSWTDQKVSHICECDEGYEHHPDTDKCITPCEHPDALKVCSGSRTCYLTNSGKKHECKCLPSFESNNNQTCEPNIKGIDYLLKNLPVKKDKYLKDGKIDQVRLSNDVIDAMNAAYLTQELKTALVFNSKIVGNSIGCDVWLQFNEGKTENAKRLTALEGKDFLPPSLELSQDKWKVELEKMTFCSEEVSKVNCGGNTICKDTNCTCKSSGFREIISTEKIQRNFKSVFCEDINECEEGNNRCTLNTTCENIVGDYNCNCKAGFKKVEKNKFECTDLCDPNPCKSGSCQKKDNAVDCKCDPGYGGSLCDAVDENFKRANQNTVIVGAVLGTLLAVVIIILAFYIRRQRKNSYSEDFTPAPRMENAEMAERGRPMRGVSNRGYQN